MSVRLLLIACALVASSLAGPALADCSVLLAALEKAGAPKVLSSMTMWIDKRSGLPLYHEMPGLSDGGFAWAFGDSVKEPKVGR